MSKVLGLSFFFHDAAAALVVDGKIIAAAAEERFDRKKHSSGFPKNAMEYVLQAGDIANINDIDAVVFYEKPILKCQRIIESSLQNWPFGWKLFAEKMPEYLSQKLLIDKLIRENLGNYVGKIGFSEHHLSHAASAYYCSPYDEAAILTIDGVGEYETTSIGHGEGEKIEIVQSLDYPNSIGLFYASVTEYLGFSVNDGEWKVMGLGAFGHAKYLEILRQFMTFHEDGSFSLNMGYFSFDSSTSFSAKEKAWERLLGFPRRKPQEPILQDHADLAHSAQRLTEALILALARAAKRLVKSENLVIAGGVGLNGLANYRIEAEKIFKNVWIHPAPGDDGAALGAALLGANIFFQDGRPAPLLDTFLGPSFSDEEICSFLKAENISAKFFHNHELVEEVADLLSGGKVVAWFQGRMEFGPRALGARSILADPRSSQMKDHVNEKVKNREYFRPFAPILPIERVHEYFDVEPGSTFPFMAKILPVKIKMRELIPAVVHQDNTARVQTVTESGNSLLYRLLIKFAEKTGVPVLLNTSFNSAGEPMVCSPKDAYHTFLNTGLDALVLGNYVITQKQNFSVSPPKTQSVFDFYRKLPFNIYSNSLDAAKDLQRENPILVYRSLHKILGKFPAGARVLDVGCGGGWFLNSLARYYKIGGIGIDSNIDAIKQARAVARLLASGLNNFVVQDLNDYQPKDLFHLVNSLGVLHHTKDCERSVRRLAGWVAPGGSLHLGLYHRTGRAPFLEFIDKLKATHASEQEMFDSFKKLYGNIDDETQLLSWFRDQVIHPHETQHGYEEISTWLSEEGFEISATSLNNFSRAPKLSEIKSLEEKYGQYARRQLYSKGRYFPGFFVVQAVRAKA